VVALADQGRAIRPTTIQTALDELATSGLAAADGQGPARRWSPLAPPGDPLLDAVDLRGAHDFRHSFATWLEDAGIPARVIDELMGHEASTRGAQHLGSTMGAHYRHTTPEMATRVVAAIQARLVVVVGVLSSSWRPSQPGCHLKCSDDYGRRFLAISGKRRSGALCAPSSMGMDAGTIVSVS
jgi:hypothetical protein